MQKYLKFALAGVVVLGLAGGGGSVMAHHSAAMFDDEVELELTGVVTRFDYLNPHSWLYMDVTEDDGSVTAWGFETNDPSRLRRVGVGPNFWAPGDEVTIITNPLRDGRPAGHLVGALKADGTEYGDVEAIGASGDAAAEGEAAAEPAAEGEADAEPAAEGEAGAGEEAELAQ